MKPPLVAATRLGQSSVRGAGIVAAVAFWMLLVGPMPAVGRGLPDPDDQWAAAVNAESDADQPARHVLLLYTEPRLQPSLVVLDHALRATLESQSPIRVRFYTEYLDLNLFDGTVPHQELRWLLRRKYALRSIDLIVAAGSQALRIALRNRAELFAGAPIVFTAVDRAAAADLRLGDDVTGTWLRQGWTETLELARRLQPETRRALVITGASAVDRVWHQAAREQLTSNAGPVEISYLAGASVEDVLKQVAQLPRRTVVLVGAFLRDASGRDSSTPEIVTRIAAASSVPVYGLTERAIGSGMVGGQVISFDAHGRLAGEQALRVLAGERPAATDNGINVPMFDARQIARWGLDARRLPGGSLVLFREPSLWQQYRPYIIGAVSLLLIQGGLIGTLLVQRVQRRRAQRDLADRLEFETLVSECSAMLSNCPTADLDRQIESGLRRIVDHLRVDRVCLWALSDRFSGTRITHCSIREGVAPLPMVMRENDAPCILSRLRQGQVFRLPESDTEASDDILIDHATLARFGTRSVAIVPLFVSGSVIGSLSVGTLREGRRWPDALIPRLRLLAEVFAGALARRDAERAERESAEHIQDLAGRLLTAQEEERRRIARDLHDGVSQELAGLSISLTMLAGRLSPVRADLAEELAQLQERTGELAEAVRQVSHELHPSALEHAGLLPALRGLCLEFQREHGVKVTFRVEDEIGVVRADLGLCLYRVAQEALRNVAKHSDARHVWVTLLRQGIDVVLTIRDDGRGFDVAAVLDRDGLGLVSLDERVHQAKGHFRIDTKPNQGTALRIEVPLFKAEDAPPDRSAR